MAYNKMENLINKIERRLRTKMIILPKEFDKDTWVDGAIIPDTLETYSRFFPNKVTIKLDTDPSKKKDGYYLIDTKLLGGEEILGCKDIVWDLYGRDSLAQQSGIGMYDYLEASLGYSMDDVALLQARSDMTSIFNTGIFVEFKSPNKIRLSTVNNGDITGGMREIPIDLFVRHSANLSTISPTMMEVFENLATSDVANYLLQYIDIFDGLETVYASVNIGNIISVIREWAGRRDDIVRILDDAHVNPSNENQPIMYTF